LINWREREMEDKEDSYKKLMAVEREHRQEVHDKILRAVNDLAGIGYKIAGIRYEHGCIDIRCWPPEKEAVSDLP
jgi:hypothetical protein